MIHENIKNLREQAGWTQAELAKMVGVTEKYISAMENGKRTPGRVLVLKLAEAFGVDERNVRFGERKEPQDARLELMFQGLDREWKEAASDDKRHRLVADFFAFLGNRKKEG